MEYLRQLLVVATLLTALGAILWFLQRRGMATLNWNRPAGRRMHVVEKLPLTAQHSVHLVRVGDKLLLIGTAPGACTVLGPMPEKDVLP